MPSMDILRWRRRNLIFSVVGIVVVFMFFFTKLSSDSIPGSSHYGSHPQTTTLDLSYLQKYKISPTFTYARRAIKARKITGERSDLTVVSETIFPQPKVLEASALAAQDINELPPITLEVPNSPKVDTSIMSFGIATKVSRLNDAIPQLSHWLSNTKSRLTVVVSPSNDTEETQSTMRKSPININVDIITSELPFIKAYFSLVKHLYESRERTTQWLVLIDDDTFFPSLPYMISHLNTVYDASKPQLVAAMSDDFDQIKTWGLIPFGGGGIFMSVPLAAQLMSPGVYEACANSTKNQGDGIFSDCVNTYTKVKPIFDHGLNQMDIMGPNSADGYFESGRRMLTVHHWKTWFGADIPRAAQVSRVIGNEGLFMRWQFAEGLVLSNGYSIANYGDGIGEVDFSKVERTWGRPNEKSMHFISPLRDPLGKDVKKSFRLVEAEMLPQGLRQIYLHKATEGENGVDGVLELLWLK